MSKTIKFKDLAKSKQVQLNTVGVKYILKMFLSGVNAGALIFMSNLIFVLVNQMYFNSTPMLLVSCVIAYIYFLNMMLKSNKETTQKFKDTVREILDPK